MTSITSPSEPYQIAGKIVRRYLTKYRKKDANLLNKIQGDQIYNVEGAFDHIHLVLNVLGFQKGVGFTNYSDYSDIAGGVKLNRNSVIFCNCNSSHSPSKAKLILKKYVERGAFLVGTDYQIRYLFNGTFPEHMRYVEEATASGMAEVEVTSRYNPFMLSLWKNGSGIKPVWWFENNSYFQLVVDKEKVKTLIQSELDRAKGDGKVISSNLGLNQLYQKYPSIRLAPIMINFKWGYGEVISFVSHLYNQQFDSTTERRKKSAIYFVEKELELDASDVEGLYNLNKYTLGQLESAFVSCMIVANILIEKMKRKLPKEI